MVNFSIIMPCYNLENYVSRTIENVLQQTYKNFELILIDDGSTDNTLRILRNYERSDHRITVISKENGGVSSARNAGIKVAKGEYLLFLDGDDLIENNLFEAANEIFERNHVDMFSFGYKTTKSSTNEVIRRYSSEGYNKVTFSGVKFQNLYFSKKISQVMCSFIVKRSIVINNFILFDENTKYAEDQEFQLRCNLNCKSIYYVSHEYFYYIQREGSAINQRMVREDFDVYFRMESYINDDSKRYYKNYLCYVFVTELRDILTRGSDKNTVEKLISIDYVLKGFTPDNTKYNFLTSLFIIFYKLVLKNYVKKRYQVK
jgi:glycosyltransferase involved in cell wall biosynthesis